jgi:hypothetical protein
MAVAKDVIEPANGSSSSNGLIIVFPLKCQSGRFDRTHADAGGCPVVRCTVARLMCDMGLAGVIRGKPVRTTISDKAAPCPRDHVNRRFYAPAPNLLGVSDFTHVATWAGFVYVALPSSSIPMLGELSISGPAERPMPASCSMLWNRRFTIVGRPIGVASSIIVIAGRNTSPSSTPSTSPKPKNNIMLPRTISIWQRDSQPNASGRPGAVQPTRIAKNLSVDELSLSEPGEGFSFRAEILESRVSCESSNLHGSQGVTHDVRGFS